MGVSLKDRRIRKDTHPFTNLFIILVVVTILANFIPSGTYERVVVDGRSVVEIRGGEVAGGHLHLLPVLLQRL